MSEKLTISLSKEGIDSGSPEEKATFGLFEITANDQLLTVGEDLENRSLVHGPHVPGYPIAEWLIWNWWRIHWEGSRPHGKENEDSTLEWELAHRMTTIGDGYAWPDITILSDGPYVDLRSEPTRDTGKVLFRYIGAARPQRVTAGIFDAEIDGFVADVLARLDDCGLHDTNLHRLWNDLEAERNDVELARFRRLEAQLGCDPDEVDETEIHQRLADANGIGEEALGELAAEAALSGGALAQMMWTKDFAQAAKQYGFDLRPRDAVALTDPGEMPHWGKAPAWRVGQCAARMVRDQELLDGHRLDDARLAEMAGTNSDVVSRNDRRFEGMTFALGSNDSARLALRSKWDTGRRFELARLIGDRLLGTCANWLGEPLLPATRAHSYRQRAQRAFAAELLSPFAAVEEMLAGDYSEDRQRDVAEYFSVSEWTIRTQLLNHGRITREEASELLDHDTGI